MPGMKSGRDGVRRCGGSLCVRTCDAATWTYTSAVATSASANRCPFPPKSCLALAVELTGRAPQRRHDDTWEEADAWRDARHGCSVDKPTRGLCAQGGGRWGLQHCRVCWGREVEEAVDPNWEACQRGKDEIPDEEWKNIRASFESFTTRARTWRRSPGFQPNEQKAVAEVAKAFKKGVKAIDKPSSQGRG